MEAAEAALANTPPADSGTPHTGPGAAAGTPAAAPASGADLAQAEAVNQKLEQRVADKEAYAERLKAETARLRENMAKLDGDISSATRERALAANALAERLRQQTPPPAPAQPFAPRPAAPAEPADDPLMGISPDEAMELMERSPADFFRKWGQATQQAIRSGIEREREAAFAALQERQQAEDIQREVAQRFQEAGKRVLDAGGNPMEMAAALQRYQARRLAPSPEHLENEVMYGPPDVQRELLRLGKAMMDYERESAKAPSPATPPPGAHPGMAFPRGTGVPPLAAAPPDPNIHRAVIPPDFQQRVAAASARLSALRGAATA